MSAVSFAQRARSAPSAVPAQEVACAHCGAAVPAGVEGDAEGRLFCCAGCEAVWHALREADLEDFYTLREATSCEVPKPASSVVVDAGLDREDFLEQHSQRLQDGSRRIELYLDGVHCAGCVWIVERMPKMLSGVLEARLDLPRARLTVTWLQELRPLSQVAQWLGRFGYVAHPIRAAGVQERSKGERAMMLRVGAGWALAGNVMLLALALYAGLDATTEPGLLRASLWLSLLLSAVSLWVVGKLFLERAWASLRAALFEGGGLASLSMDVPIALGVLVGWLHSAYITAFGALDGGEPEVWFDSVSVLLAALMTARWLQLRGRRRAGDAADRLLALLPRDARRVEADGSRASVSADALRPGDRVEVLGGEVVPADGVVAVGSSSIHRGVLTGESRPEKVGPGQEVHAGTTNLGSPLEVVVSAAGSQTRVGRLLAWIEGESRRRAPLLQKVDRWGGMFIATVLVVALLTFVGWSFVDPNHALRAAVAVLVISCPCALGMATPLSLVVAVGQAARRGIFIKHDDVLEKLAEVTHVVLDKTGTLTEGRMSVVKVEGDGQAARLAARLEAHSQHPIARALVGWAQELRADDPGAPQDIEEVVGAGLRGRFGGAGGQVVAVGKAAWVLGEADAAQKLRWEAEVARLGEEGLTPVLVSVGGEVRAAFGLGDPLRASSQALIEALRARGAKPLLLSGDDPRLVERTAARLGMGPQEALGGVSPEEKRAFVEGLKADPKAVVMMVGDGVNDAAALQAAHVGVAVHGGAQASLVAADIFTTRPGLDPVLELLEGAEQVLGTVRRGLFISAGYNLAGMSLAAFGLAGPLLGAIAMPISSLVVVASSLSQRSFRPKAP